MAEGHIFVEIPSQHGLSNGATILGVACKSLIIVDQHAISEKDFFITTDLICSCLFYLKPGFFE